jgi:signal transduction histidine kinase
MTIRNTLSLKFTIIVASILIVFSFFTYIFSEKYRHNEFTKRLKTYAENNALLYFTVNKNDNIQNIESSEKESIYKENTCLFNENKKLIYQSNPSNNIPLNSEWLNINEGEVLEFSFDDYEIVSFTLKVDEEVYLILASGIDKYGLKELNYLKIILIIGNIIGIIIVFFLGRFFASQALKPISKIIQKVDSINEQNLHERLKIETNNQDELNQLSQTFNKMLERIEDAFIMKRNFVSNASHELRTPLTAITGQLEVTLLKKRNADEYENTIKSVLNDIKKLNQICNGLLQLTYSNNKIDNLIISKIRIDELLWDVRKDLIKIYPEYKIEIDFSNMPENEEKLYIKGNIDLVRTAFINVIQNACKYSPDKTAKVLLEFNNKTIKIQVKDNGIGIDEKDLKYIFRPFYRGNNAKCYEGNGLGLSLCKRIIEKYEGKISLNSKLNTGTIVFIEMPVAA